MEIVVVYIFFSVQEMAKTAQARKGIQTSPDGELASIFFKETQRDSVPVVAAVVFRCDSISCIDHRYSHSQCFWSGLRIIENFE